MEFDCPSLDRGIRLWCNWGDKRLPFKLPLLHWFGTDIKKIISSYGWFIQFGSHVLEHEVMNMMHDVSWLSNVEKMKVSVILYFFSV